MSTIVLYTTAGCHLCEQAESLLSTLAALNALDWRAVEISDNAQWVEQYGLRIPVIQVAGAQQTLDWPFDEAALLAYLARHLP